MKLNPLGTQRLGAPASGGTIYASLEREDTGEAWPFLLNPQSISVTKAATYEPLTTPGQDLPRRQFIAGEAKTLRLDGLLLATNDRRSLRPLLEALDTLMEIAEGYEPPTLSFVWGSRRFEPCKVVRYELTETEWGDNGPTKCTGSIELVEVPPTPEPSPTEVPEQSGTIISGMELTERQVSEGADAVRNWVSNNQSRLPSEVQGDAQLSQTDVDINPQSGVVNLLNRAGVSVPIGEISLEGVNLGEFIPWSR